jgi:hypothetical protein
MEIVDILFLIYLCLVLVIMIRFIPNIEKILAIYIISIIIIGFMDNLFLGIFNINYLNSNDNTLKRIGNILIGSLPIVVFIVVLVRGILPLHAKRQNHPSAALSEAPLTFR